ncbi:hypothetical protein RB195_003641 [Necator americanus]|uniref:Uncharacterized protein n=1 Tax=Necator americanus TaxID=51031 RepID=A0ABR1DR07_NECAM
MRFFGKKDFLNCETAWRNGSAFDSRSKGWAFDPLSGQEFCTRPKTTYPLPYARIVVGNMRLFGKKDFLNCETAWRNGSAFDSRSKGWAFDPLSGQEFCTRPKTT